MDSRSLAEQEKDIKDLLRRAERTPVKTSALRKDTLKRLIDLAHSPHPSLKVIAATNVKLFIRDFPELEDDAINAVYDLCEDPVSSVRIKGYAAIVDVSREQQKWVKRNADVLVQLLQSDEPEEVTFVKRALTQHLDMDPTITLGVICDQIVPPDEPLDEEEQAIRDRLRSLVLAFLAGEAKRSLVERHANIAGSPAEQVLVNSLFKAITKLPPSELDVIVKDILASLPSFKPPSSRGKELLDLLLGQARAMLKSDLPSSGESGSLYNVRYYLDLASFITVENRLSAPSHLLRFYYSNLTPKLVLGRLAEDDQAYVIRRVAETFAAYDETGVRAPPTAPAADVAKQAGNGPDFADDGALRKQFIDICSVLLQVFADMESEGERPWAACHTLLQGVVRRTKENRSQAPAHIVSSLRRIESLPEPQDAHTEDKATQAQVHSVIRLLLDPIKPSAAPASQANVSAPVGQSDGQKGNVRPLHADKSANGARRNGPAGTGASKGEGRRIMNINKRKLGDSDGPATGSPSSPSSSRTTIPPSPRGPRNRLPASLPPRPTGAPASSGALGAPSGPRADRQRQPPPHLRDRPALSASAAKDTTNNSSVRLATPPGASQQDDGTSRSAKKARTEGRKGEQSGSGSNQAPTSAQATDSTPIPSLLSRLNPSAQNGKAAASAAAPEREQAQRDRGQGRRGRGDAERSEPIIPAKRRTESSASNASGPPVPPSSARSRPSRPSPDLDKVPAGGYSIRGAAKAASQPAPTGGDGSASKNATSLLQRLQPLGGGHAPDDGGGRRGRKRSRHA
ncbi:Apoptosis inhibitor 5-A [Trametes pubescens]|uniref:Apoptosis inhibitor 5-A n=1 Tax=Trametes pubescens TaxID=154538 RepID=A0A1M2V4V5_TRAPU|nr:Apoptosis inhibitor 5-A [Trametes pubescens]